MLPSVRLFLLVSSSTIIRFEKKNGGLKRKGRLEAAQFI
jgi:hypothetical protein